MQRKAKLASENELDVSDSEEGPEYQPGCKGDRDVSVEDEFAELGTREPLEVEYGDDGY